MPENQAKPNTEQKLDALESALSKLIARVDGLVSRKDSRSDAHRDDDRRDDDRRDDDDKRDDDKAKKDAARDTLFGGKRKDAKRDDDDKRDDDKRDDDRRDDESEDEEEEEKESKGDAKRDDDEGEAEPMASDDDRRKDRRKDAKRDDSHRDDKRRDDDRRDDDDDRRDDGRRKDAKRDDESEDEDEKEERDDARRYDDKRDDARGDSAMIRGLRDQISRLERSIRRPRIMTDDELNALSEKQSEWDRVAQMHGLRASRPLDGERINSYDRRMAKQFQKHSAKWKDADLSAMPIEVVASVIAPEIRADSITAAYRVEPSEGGMQREVRRQDRTGRWISEFVGPVNAVNGALAPFRMAPMRVLGINTNPNRF